MTQVSEVMSRGVRTLSPRDPIVRAAQAMEELDIGVVPVCEGDRLVGMVTDRDIVVRGIAHGRPAEQTPLDEVDSDAGLGADSGAGAGTSADTGDKPVVGDGTGGHLAVGKDDAAEGSQRSGGA